MLKGKRNEEGDMRKWYTKYGEIWRMNELLLTLIWLLLYGYVLERLTKIEENWKLRGAVFSVSVFFLYSNISGILWQY